VSEASWPGGARGALSLSFDNLGEAAEIELGAVAPEDAGDHPTVTRVLPALLAALGERDIAATFFVEGLNAELYPEALKAIEAAGHEVGYHAWRHEQWGDLSAAEQSENLARGLAAFRQLGLDPDGLRPPGGGLGPGGLGVLREVGLRYCSPVGDEARVQNGIAVLPFHWHHVDASCVLPLLATAREAIAGSPDPVEPSAFLAYLVAEIERLAAEGGFATFILHPFMLGWFGEDNLATLLDRIGSSDIWTARCNDVAEHMLSRSR
jgi:peptidoglycan/xylan/chitin deacetylase (PgdA/CDA1 family)